MSFQKIAGALGITEYPAALDTYYPLAEKRNTELCSFAMIDSLQERFDLFGAYYHDVRAAFGDLCKEPFRKACMDVYSLYLKDSPTEAALKLKCPPCTGTPGSNMFGLFIHLPSLDNSYRNMRSRGFTETEAIHCMGIYKIYLQEGVKYRYGFVGITPGIASWLVYFTKGEIFYPGFCGLNYQITSMPEESSPLILKHRKNGQIVLVFAGKQKIHRTGIPLGSAGASDSQGAFETVLEENDTAYYGHPVINCRVSPGKESFSKNEWEKALGPGDDVISVHLFFESDIAPETVSKSLAAAYTMAKRCFPERTFKAFFCASWILSPVLNEVLGDNSKISAFSSRFTRYPTLSGGMSVYNYVFPGAHTSAETLPEETRLQRGLKQRILKGDSIYETKGVILL